MKKNVCVQQMFGSNQTLLYLGVGIRGEISPMRSLFMKEGYLSVVVDTDIIVDTNSLIWANVGF